MSRWLQPVRAALDLRHDDSLSMFVRDDDGGWEDGKLERLLEQFSAWQLPIDVAVIPRALSDALASQLRSRKQQLPQLLGLHQHGFAHCNHEISGRKCEFGEIRTAEQQAEDIAAGKRILERMLPGLCDPLFTPPWNRCTQGTVRALQKLDFVTLSRNVGAQPLDLDGMNELPVALDWQRYSHDLTELGQQLAKHIVATDNRPLGIMLHHGVMKESDMDSLAACVDVLAGSAKVRFQCMRSCSGLSDAAGAGATIHHSDRTLRYRSRTTA